MKDDRLVWSDEKGDLRKKKNKNQDIEVNEEDLTLHLRRLTKGKGRTVIEISELPANEYWCKGLAKELKKTIGVGGSLKKGKIEIHGEKIEQVEAYLTKRKIHFKKVGG